MIKVAPDNYHLDIIDKEIIQMLMHSNKTSIQVISNKIGISVTASYLRVKKLEKAGVVVNSFTVLDPKKIGYDVVSYIGVFLDQHSRYSDFISSLQDINEILEAHYTTGSYNFFLKVTCKDNNHLMLVLRKLHDLKEVARTETFVSLEQSINRQLKIF